MERRKDLTGKEPVVGDFIAYNPPYYKGIIIACVIGFAKSGLPIVVDKEELDIIEGENYKERADNFLDARSGNYSDTPKTGFVIVTFP